MRRLNLAFLALCIFCNVKLFAQKSFSEGDFSYAITITGLNGEPSEILKGSTLHIYLKPSLSRSDMKSSFGSETNIYDNKNGKGFLLKEYSGQKLMITMNKDNWYQKNQLYNKLIFQVGEEFTDIAGQRCKKASALLPDGKIFVVYFNPEILIVNKEYNNAFPNLPGLPVQYEMQSGSLSFKYSLQSISWEPVSASKFETPKNGFRIMSFDENQQLKKGE